MTQISSEEAKRIAHNEGNQRWRDRLKAAGKKRNRYYTPEIRERERMRAALWRKSNPEKKKLQNRNYKDMRKILELDI